MSAHGLVSNPVHSPRVPLPAASRRRSSLLRLLNTRRIHLQRDGVGKPFVALLAIAVLQKSGETENMAAGRGRSDLISESVEDGLNDYQASGSETQFTALQSVRSRNLANYD